MAEFDQYLEASKGARIGAFLINLLLLGLALTPLNMWTTSESSEEVGWLIISALIVVFSAFPETPGKRLLKLSLVTEERKRIGFKERLIRSSPFLFFWLCGGAATSIPMNGGDPAMMSPVAIAFTLIYLLSMLFLLADGLAVFFSPLSQSLMDMKLGTIVVTPPPSPQFPDRQRPTLFGVKIPRIR